ncbi:MAG: hypothetical protein GTO18_17495 [Anaerolineales bacterium]|nr:hypothetical protein [Anaerolineales bacterium]
MPDKKLSRYQSILIRIWMTLLLVGFFLFVIGINPNLIGMDRSPVVGFVQVGVWLFGLALMLISAYAAIRIFRNGRPTSLRAEIGERLIATGYVFAAASSAADFIGIGSHSIPEVIFGPIQVIGLTFGVVTSLIGIILYWPWPRRKKVEDSEEVTTTDQEVGGEVGHSVRGM